MKSLLYFKASTNIKSLVGKDLVTDEIAAIFELVKNSYDADAEEVIIEFHGLKGNHGKITIRDDGTGMDLNDIENKWMVIGTDSKKNKGFSNKFKRPLNGDKGIGRFSVDRLGKRLKLVSVNEYDSINTRISMDFDWSLFDEKNASLEDISFPFTVDNMVKEKKGVSLEIAELRDQWDKSKLEKLEKNLRHFKSPFKINDNFKIIIEAKEFFEDRIEIMPFELDQISKLWVRTTIEATKVDNIKIEVFRDGIKYEENYPNNYKFGPILSEVYFFDQSAKVSFKSRMKMSVREFGNVRLYRDNFRIHPYGEESNDWLELDKRRAQGIARFFGTRDIIGFVQITKQHNNELKVLTNRQGLLENDNYFDLKKFLISNSIRILEKYFFKKNENEAFKIAKENVNVAVTEIKKVAKNIHESNPETSKVLLQLANVVQKSQSDQVQFVKNQEELIKVYSRAAKKELLLHKIIHEGLIRIERIKTVSSSSIRRLEKNKLQKADGELITFIETKIKKINSLSSEAKDYLMTARDHLVRQRQAESINLRQFIQENMLTFEDALNEEHINLSLEMKDNLYYKFDKEDLRTIINNFISNSIKSLKQISGERSIKIKVTDTNSFIIMVFSDNGLGVPDHLKNRIFDPLFSTTNGFGMGLSIVDEIVKEYSGELNLGVNEGQGAEFHIKFRK